ncbi:hypothetical protein ANANG_G00298860, partial [Anguilla anguilla]
MLSPVVDGDHLEGGLPYFQDGVVLLGPRLGVVVLPPPALVVAAVPGEQGAVPVDVPAHQGQHDDGQESHRPADDGRQRQAGVLVRLLLLLPVQGGGGVVRLHGARLRLDADGRLVRQVNVTGFHGNHAYPIGGLGLQGGQQVLPLLPLDDGLRDGAEGGAVAQLEPAEAQGRHRLGHLPGNVHRLCAAGLDADGDDLPSPRGGGAAVVFAEVRPLDHRPLGHERGPLTSGGGRGVGDGAGLEGGRGVGPGAVEQVGGQVLDGHALDLVGPLAHEAPHVDPGGQRAQPVPHPLHAAAAVPGVVAQQQLRQVVQVVEDALRQAAQVVAGQVQAVELAQEGEGPRRHPVDVVVLELQLLQAGPRQVGGGRRQGVAHQRQLGQVGQVGEGRLPDAPVVQQVAVQDQPLEVDQVLQGLLGDGRDAVVLEAQLLDGGRQPQGDGAQVVPGQEEQPEVAAVPEGPFLDADGRHRVVVQVQLLDAGDLRQRGVGDGAHVVLLQVQLPHADRQVGGELVQAVAVQVDLLHAREPPELGGHPRAPDAVVLQVEDRGVLGDPHGDGGQLPVVAVDEGPVAAAQGRARANRRPGQAQEEAQTGHQLQEGPVSAHHP